MFNDFDLEVTCEEYYGDDYEAYELEMGFDPYEGGYTWDC